MDSYIKSPMNYTGGKYKILNDIIPSFPSGIKNFVDLFAGGLNVGINVNAGFRKYYRCFEQSRCFFRLYLWNRKSLIPLLLGPTLKISVIVSRPFLTHSGFFLCEPPRSAVDKPSAARYNTFQRPSTGANLQLLRRILSLSQCAAFVKGDPLYGRFESRYAYHQGGASA